jgi:diguanylate cyclase (GGDEF)-like protein
MTKTPSSGSGAFPGAAYGAQLQCADPARPFDPALEAEYVRSRLLNSRTLIRMACLFGLVITCLRIAEFTATEAGRQVFFARPMILFPAVVLAMSALLAWLAWSPIFARRYLPLANFVVPARNIFAGIAVAAIAARGQVELLMVLPAMVLSPFFFLGLHFRSALVCVALTIASFAVSALVFALPLPVLLRSSGFLIITAATSAVAAWQLERQFRRSFLEGRLITQLAEHDALTGAKNRRVFDEQLGRMWQQALDDGRRLAILLIDVDHFKAYNDRYGHQAGDVALRRVARTLQTHIPRPVDVLARYGGEEFAAILYDIDSRQAREIAERMRLAVSALRLENRGSRADGVVTISIGVAAIQPSPERAPRGALQLADEALYAAKVGGRDKVHLAGESDYSDLETGIFAQGVDGS